MPSVDRVLTFYLSQKHQIFTTKEILFYPLTPWDELPILIYVTKGNKKMEIKITKRENSPTKAIAEIYMDGEIFRVRIMEGRYGKFIMFPDPASFTTRKRAEIQSAVLKAYRNVI